MAVDTITATLHLYLGAFQRSLRAENIAQKTVDCYTQAVTGLDNVLRSRGMPLFPHLITREHNGGFIADIHKRCKPATASNRYRPLQRYFRWLVEDGEIKESPMAKIHPPKVLEQLAPVVSDDAITKLLKACSGADFEDRRDLAVIRLFLDTGSRRSELANLPYKTWILTARR